MRTKLELWQLVGQNFDKFFWTGLCGVIVTLRIKAIIDMNEHIALLNEIKHFGYTGEFFLGNKGDAQPRKEFIQNRIKAHGGL